MRKSGRVLAFGICAATVFAFSGCDEGKISKDGKTYGGKTASAVYASATEGIENSEDNFTMNIEMVMDSTTNSLGSSQTMSTQANLRYGYVHGEEFLETVITSSQNLYGKHVKTVNTQKEWYVNGVNYQYEQNTFGGTEEETTKSKKKVAKDEWYSPNDLDVSDLSIPESVLETCTFSELGESIVLSATVDMDGIAQSVEGLFSFFEQFMNGFSFGFSLDISEMNVNVYLTKSAQLKYITFDYDMDMSMLFGLASGKAETVILLSFESLGSTTVTPPPDGETYTDLTPPKGDDSAA